MICNKCGTIIDEDYDFYCRKCECCYSHCMCAMQDSVETVDGWCNFPYVDEDCAKTAAGIERLMKA